MDFDLAADQRALLTRLTSAVEATGGLERAHAETDRGVIDSALDQAVGADRAFVEADLLARALVVEEAARLGLALDLGTRLVVAGELELPTGAALGYLDLDRRGPVRYGADASALLVVSGDTARLLTSGFSAFAVESGMSFPYATVDTSGGGEHLPAGSAQVLRRRRLIALAAEVAGAASTGLAHTAAYLQGRVQFGRPLSELQALRHRVAEAAVYAEGLSWLARWAAFTDDDQSAAIAASYAFDTAARLAPELTQLCGARGFAREFGLHVFTMRLQALRAELGNQHRIAARSSNTTPLDAA